MDVEEVKVGGRNHDVDIINILVFQVEALSDDDDGSKNSLEFEHDETEEVANNIKRELVWEWDSEIESKNKIDLQCSENHGGMSIFVKEELSVKNEYDDGKSSIKDEEIKTTMNKDPLEMKNDFSTASKSYPIKGKRNHSAEKSFKCDQCKFSTAFKSSLITHMFTHEAEKPYKCDQCKFSTPRKSSLTTHMFMHGGEKPFKCDQCGYSTARKSSLITHMFTHGGEKPNKCDQWNYSTFSKATLTRHKIIHSQSTQDPLRINRDTIKVSDAFILLIEF